MNAPHTLIDITLTCKASVYFDGKVISHSFTETDGSKKSIGVIFPGQYNFGTEAPEVMQIIAGNCTYRLAGEDNWNLCQEGSSFSVSGNSSFDIAVDEGLVEYICSYG